MLQTEMRWKAQSGDIEQGRLIGRVVEDGTWDEQLR